METNRLMRFFCEGIGEGGGGLFERPRLIEQSTCHIPRAQSASVAMRMLRFGAINGCAS